MLGDADTKMRGSRPTPHTWAEMADSLYPNSLQLEIDDEIDEHDEKDKHDETEDIEEHMMKFMNMMKIVNEVEIAERDKRKLMK